MEPTVTDLKTTIRRLSKAQRAAFDRICEGRLYATGAASATTCTAPSLVRRGLIRAVRPSLYVPEQEPYSAWMAMCGAWESARFTHCPECGAELFLIENRRICPNGHGKSVPVGVRARDLKKAERKRVEIVAADLTKVPLSGFKA